MPLLEGLRSLVAGRGGRGTPGAANLSEWTQAVLIQEAGGRYEESAWNGEIFITTSGLVATPAAGPLGAAGTPIIALWNPAGSGFQAWIRRVGAFATATGTTSGKGHEIDIGPTAAITAAVNAAGIKTDGSGATDTDLKGFANTALTGSTAISRLRPVNAYGNTAAQGNVDQIPENLDGAIMLNPGSLIAITALATGVANESIAFIEYIKRKL